MILILGEQQDKWIDIADDVQLFTHAKWVEWTETKPEWFTENFIASVPDRYIPQTILAELNCAAPSGKRERFSVRNSLFGTQSGNHVRIVPVVSRMDDNILSLDSNVNRITIKPRVENILSRAEEGGISGGVVSE